MGNERLKKIPPTTEDSSKLHWEFNVEVRKLKVPAINATLSYYRYTAT